MNRGTVLITGASSGIGEAFAHRFAAEDFSLILTARREDRLASLREELGADKVKIIPADLSDPEGIAGFCNALTESGAVIDVLVNNAGILYQDSFDNLSPAQVQEMLTLNVFATTQLMHHLLPGMKQRQSGRILNVASVAAFNPVPGMDLYAATKAFLLSLSESMAENLKGSGVHVTALCPGITRTEGMNERLAEMLPGFAIMSPDEVAAEGFDALMNQEAVRVPGDANKIAVSIAQHQPRWLMRGLGGLAARLTR